MDEGVTLLDGQNFHGSLILYAISDIQIGEEVTIAYVQDTHKPLSHLHHELRTRHGFQCRDCPRCRNYLSSPTPYDYERSKDPGALQGDLIRRLMYLQAAFTAEERLISVGGSNGGGPRSLQKCFAQSVSGLREWIAMGELAFDRLHWHLHQARWHLGFCYETRQEYAQAVAVFEKMTNTEREIYPRYSHLRIYTLKRLLKMLALNGQGETARFDELVEEVR